MEAGESEVETALREMEEETGVAADDVELDQRFRFATSYDVWPKRFGGKLCRKTTVIFLARPKQNDVPVQVTEHLGFEWHRWNPPHEIQAETIDPLLAELESYLENYQDTSSGT
jgi:8-oxo-dGTP pyrophosphatase MutT (NUDIX family)